MLTAKGERLSPILSPILAAAAVFLAANLLVSDRWIVSGRNPADSGSRWFDGTSGSNVECVLSQAPSCLERPGPLRVEAEWSANALAQKTSHHGSGSTWTRSPPFATADKCGEGTNVPFLSINRIIPSREDGRVALLASSRMGRPTSSLRLEAGLVPG